MNELSLENELLPLFLTISSIKMCFFFLFWFVLILHSRFTFFFAEFLCYSDSMATTMFSQIARTHRVHFTFVATKNHFTLRNELSMPRSFQFIQTFKLIFHGKCYFYLPLVWYTNTAGGTVCAFSRNANRRVEKKNKAFKLARGHNWKTEKSTINVFSRL